MFFQGPGGSLTFQLVSDSSAECMVRLNNKAVTNSGARDMGSVSDQTIVVTVRIGAQHSLILCLSQVWGRFPPGRVT